MNSAEATAAGYELLSGPYSSRISDEKMFVAAMAELDRTCSIKYVVVLDGAKRFLYRKGMKSVPPEEPDASAQRLAHGGPFHEFTSYLPVPIAQLLIREADLRFKGNRNIALWEIILEKLAPGEATLLEAFSAEVRMLFKRKGVKCKINKPRT